MPYRAFEKAGFKLKTCSSCRKSFIRSIHAALQIYSKRFVITRLVWRGGAQNEKPMGRMNWKRGGGGSHNPPHPHTTPHACMNKFFFQSLNILHFLPHFSYLTVPSLEAPSLPLHLLPSSFSCVASSASVSYLASSSFRFPSISPRLFKVAIPHSFY